MMVWTVLIAGGILTYAIRLSFILLLGRVEMPEWLLRALRLVPPSVLSAIIFPEVLMHTGSLDISFTNFRLLAALVAVLVAWRTRNVVFTLLVGMIAFLILQAAFGIH